MALSVMFRQILCYFLAWLLLALGQLSAAFAAERRVALVIGNAKYKEAPLINPVNDARDMAAALQRTGFEVIMAVDATQKEMNRAIARFGERLQQDSVALFYYAGHGMQVRGKNYLIPIDAEIKTESSVRVESVDVDGVLDQLSTSDLNVVILDACRNNPFERRANRSVGAAGLAQMEAPKGSLIAYATAPGRTAADGEGRNGLYTQELLKQIQIPALTIEQVFKNVRREVAKATRDTQIPWEASSLTGDFYFLPGTHQSPTAPQAARRPSETPIATSTSVAKPTTAPPRQNGGDSATAKPPLTPPTASQTPANTIALPAQSQAAAPAVQAEPSAPLLKPANQEPPSVAVTQPSTQAEAPIDLKEQVIQGADFRASGRLLLDRASGTMSGEGVIEWTNGDRYEGTMLAGKKHGKGIFTWKSGQRYEGEWVDDRINGKGVVYFTNGDRYEGTFEGGEPHGTGTYTMRNGDYYTGAWVHGNKHGFGRLTWAAGDYWEGEFRDGKQTDNGRMHSSTVIAERMSEQAAASEKAAPKKKGK